MWALKGRNIITLTVCLKLTAMAAGRAKKHCCSVFSIVTGLSFLNLKEAHYPRKGGIWNTLQEISDADPGKEFFEIYVDYEGNTCTVIITAHRCECCL